MKPLTRRLRIFTSTVLGSIALAFCGCGWTNDEGATPGQIFEGSIRSFGLSEANGEAGQDAVKADKLELAGQLFRRSNKQALQISTSDEMDEKPEEFADNLRRLALEWAAANSQALEKARGGDKVAMNESLDLANGIQDRIDSLIAETDFEELTDGETNNREASESLNRFLDYR